MQQFKGFKPEAMQRIAGTLGYQGDMSNFNDYLNQNPDKMQQMGMYQQKALQMVNGGMVQNFANGGDVDYRTYYDQKGNVQNLDIDDLFKQPAQQAQQGVGAVLKQDGSIDNTAMMKQKQQGQQQPVQLPKDKLQPQPIQPVDPRDPVPPVPAQGLRRVDTLAGAKDKLQPQPIQPEPQPQPLYSVPMDYDSSMKALNMSVGKEEQEHLLFLKKASLLMMNPLRVYPLLTSWFLIHLLFQSYLKALMIFQKTLLLKINLPEKLLVLRQCLLLINSLKT